MKKTLITRRTLLASSAAAASLPLIGSSASAQAAWPSKPVRIVVGYPAGGQTDGIARAYSEFLTRHFGQTFVVENKGGGSGSVGAIDVKNSPPDGHTLMCTISTTMIQNRATIKNLAYDPEKDFAIFSVVKGSGLLMVVQTSSGVTNLKEFIEFAKKADKVSMGTYAVGSTPHIVAFELNKQFGLKIEPIHYRGEAPMWADFMAGSIETAIGSFAVTSPVLQSNRGRLIGTTGSRIKPYPDIPTLAEQGAGSKLFSVRGFTGWFAPAKTPPEIVKKLSDAMVLAGKDPKVESTLSNYYLEPASDMVEANRQFTEESPVLLSVLKDLGIQAE
jgi:tripartite-type tricarboxylate transporter receptor subunit TctC